MSLTVTTSLQSSSDCFLNSLQQTAFGNKLVTKTTIYRTVILLNSGPQRIKDYF